MPGTETWSVRRPTNCECGAKSATTSMLSAGSEPWPNPYASPRGIEPAWPTLDWTWLVLVAQVVIFLACAAVVALTYPVWFVFASRSERPTLPQCVSLLCWGYAVASVLPLIWRMLAW